MGRLDFCLCCCFVLSLCHTLGYAKLAYGTVRENVKKRERKKNQIEEKEKAPVLSPLQRVTFFFCRVLAIPLFCMYEKIKETHSDIYIYIYTHRHREMYICLFFLSFSLSLSLSLSYLGCVLSFIYSPFSNFMSCNSYILCV